MSTDNPHINPTEGIEDVELEDDELEEKSFEELVKDRREQTQEALQQYRESVGTEDGEETTEKSEDAESDSERIVSTIEEPTVETDGDLIKYTGIARMDVDITDPDEEALNELIKEAEHGEVEAGMERGLSENPVFDSLQDGTQHLTESVEKTEMVPDMEPSKQAAALAKETTEDLNIGNIVKNAAELPKSPSGVREEVYETVYTEITKYVRTMYGASSINNSVLKSVREKIATDAANRACVLRRAAEDGVTVDAEGYNPEEGGEETVDEDTQQESEEGGETDAPQTEEDSDDVDLSEDDLDLEG